MRNLEVGIPALLEDNIQLLVYAGEHDLICNWLGNSNSYSSIGKITQPSLRLTEKIKKMQEIQDGFMQCHGLVRKILLQHQMFHF